MDLFVFWLFRALILVLERLPIEFTFRLGSFFGEMAHWLFIPYRCLALHNLTIAFGKEKTPREISRLARAHFRNLAANLLVIPKLGTLSQEELRARLDIEGADHVTRLIAAKRGILMVCNHLGNWEIAALAIVHFPGVRFQVVYQKIANPHIDAYVRAHRARFGLQLLERKEGFGDAIKALREGCVTGVLIDQHAGDGGVWTPFFNRLASTTPLISLMAARSGAALVPIAIQTTGIARWKWVIEPPLPDEKRTVEATTAELNRILEKQIRRTPHEWFWVHERWKTPSPEFLLANTKRYRRGIFLPPELQAADLQPFRVVVRSSNWLGDAVMTVPAVRAIKYGRPDLHLTILCPQKLVDLWQLIPEVDHVIGIKPGETVFGVAARLRILKFDAGILLPNSVRTTLELFLAGIPRRVGFDRQGRRHLLNQIIRDPKKPGPAEHQSLHYLRLAETLGADLSQGVFPTFPAHKPYPPLRLALCPGAEYGPAKRWLPERFAAVAHAVAQRRHCEWLILGTAGDAPLAEELARQIGPAARSLAGKTSLAQLIATLRECSALLTNDTGTMHLAALLGVPTISVFGSTEPILTGPLGLNHQVIRQQVECSPCFLRVCPIDFRCMKAVAVDQVIEAVLKTT